MLIRFLTAALALSLLFTNLSDADAQSGQAGAMRCGWYDNPTPGNHWLTDRDGQWTITTQGLRGPPGAELVPDMTTRGWIRTNGNYGFGCGCFRMSVDPATRRVTRIYGARPMPLTRCHADRALPSRR
jgi:hypothetical protein